MFAGTGEGPRLAAQLLQCGWSLRVSVVSAAAGEASTAAAPRRLSRNSPALSAMRTKRASGNTAGEP
jgi:hypothetical protein